MIARAKDVAVESPAQPEREQPRNPQASRETVESIVIAIVLAFLFRGFIAEAFVIPTGSMAPTLQGRHMDVSCPQCGFQYRTGASSENPDSPVKYEVQQTTCPLCRYTMELQKRSHPNQRSFTGDRILVSKFSYLFNEPKRWDVIVFKYPGNAKQNYIKRLVGLPGESLLIQGGDVYTLPSSAGSGDAEGRIARKPPEKVTAMLQLVHDTKYVSPELQAVGWPSRWQGASVSAGEPGWQAVAPDQSWSVAATANDAWLRYHHVIPWPEDWSHIARGERPPRLDSYEGQLITDYYEYNDSDTRAEDAPGLYWVGDLAVECDVDVKQAVGELLLDLVEGGTHFTCRIALDTGRATLAMQGGAGVFVTESNSPAAQRTAQTPLREAGSYRLQFANVDNQILLWVDGKLIPFDGPATYDAPRNLTPHWSEQDPGDLAPIGVGARQAQLQVNRLRVLRDVYYVAVEADRREREYSGFAYAYAIQQIMASPREWSRTTLFESRRSVRFDLAPDQFFPMGDNSPQSKDARLWSGGSRLTGYRDPPPYVDRKLLIGKAVLIYWPHPWRGPFGIPLIPNLSRMGLIH
jgi:signal peptidase I